jgi:two-component system sensor histidine kinase KdpD
VSQSSDVRSDHTAARKRGTLRVYLGAAPGVGKTFAMLNEGRRRHERGTDVVVGYVETHGRARTAEQVGDLEVVPRRTVTYRGSSLTEMDTEAILRRHPRLVLVDELAHTNAPGSKHEKRWQDVGDILAAGIDVISTVNIQHLESLNDVVERITGIRQRETIPDHVVRAADDIELVDMAPEALRRRLAHGNVYAPEKIDAALGNYFRPGNLSALRELALLWVADRVDDALQDYRDRHGITRPWETRERVVVALAGAPDTDHIIRRAARMAQRAKGDLIGVHVISDNGLTSGGGPDADAIASHRRLIEELGGEYRRVTSNDVASALVNLARAENATQIVMGASARSWWQEIFSGSVINKVVRLSGPIDVHVISRPADRDTSSERRLPAVRQVLTPLSRRRQLWGWVIAVIGLPLVTVAFVNMRDTIGLPTVLLLYLVLAMIVALVGGIFPAMAAVVGGFLLANWYFTPPLYQFTITEPENLLALIVYVVAAGMVAVLVDRVGRIRRRSLRLQAEAEALAALAGSLARPGSVGDMLGQLRSTFGFTSASLIRNTGDGWEVVEASGPNAPQRPEDADVSRDLVNGVTLALAGGVLTGDDEQVLNTFGTQVAAAAEHERLQQEAGRAAELAAANTLRASLLQAVSHDLRTPLASIKAAISSLRQDDVTWSRDAVAEFEATIEEETDRLTHIVGNILDMSRIQAGALSVQLQPTAVEDVVIAAIDSLGPGNRPIDVDIPEAMQDVLADPDLLERALANVIGNAMRYAPPGTAVHVSAGEVVVDGARRIDLRVVDQGEGIPRNDRDLVFQPFQRVVDNQADGAGVGLGLAIARGFVDAMDGELTVDDTPGGGATLIIELAAAPLPGDVPSDLAPTDALAAEQRPA